MSSKTIKENETKHLKKIEFYLKNYKTFTVGIQNLQKQLNYIIPGFNENYQLNSNTTGMFVHTSENECYGVDRIVSRKAFILNEDMEKYKIIVNSINKALSELDEVEYEFIDSRYLKGKTIIQTSFDLGYSEKYIFTLRKKTLNKLLISLKGLIQF